MTVKILIKRKVPDSQSEALRQLLRQFRGLAIEYSGYISGETLKRVDHPGGNLVISTWKSADDWHKWFNNPGRKSIQSQIDVLLGSVTTYEVYEAD